MSPNRPIETRESEQPTRRHLAVSLDKAWALECRQ